MVQEAQIGGISSPTLEDLNNMLDQVKEFVTEVLIPNIEEERRRNKNSEDVFENSVRNLTSANIVFPQPVLNALKDS